MAVTVERVKFYIDPSYSRGAKMKVVVNQILSACSDISIAETLVDTDDDYQVYLSWKGHRNWVIKTWVTSSNYYCFGIYSRLTNGTYTECVNESRLNMDSYWMLEVVKRGSDFLTFALVDIDDFNSTADGGLNIMFFDVVDQFTKESRKLVTVDISYSKFYSMGDLYTVHDDITVKCKLIQNANGLTPNGLTSAIPVVFYTDSSVVPLSGFVAGEALFYYVFSGADQTAFTARFTKFSIDGHGFMSLGNYLCIKTD